MGTLKWRNPRVDPKLMDDMIQGMDPVERAVTINAAIATREARVKLTDRRLLVMFVGLVVAVWWLVHNQSEHFDAFKKAQTETNNRAIFNCRQTQRGFDQINAFYDKQEALTRARHDLSPAVKQQAIANDETSKLKKLQCF